jgi:hypothetical protein
VTYLPLDYYDTLVRAGDIRGPKGGIVVAYDNVSRHIHNDLFVSLVRGGWIGSRTATTAKLTELVLDALRDGKSMTVASEGSSDDDW